jgi:hypothetical protein
MDIGKWLSTVSNHFEYGKSAFSVKLEMTTLHNLENVPLVVPLLSVERAIVHTGLSLLLCCGLIPTHAN